MTTTAFTRRKTIKRAFTTRLLPKMPHRAPALGSVFGMPRGALAMPAMVTHRRLGKICTAGTVLAESLAP